jgi:hypothetical protein
MIANFSEEEAVLPKATVTGIPEEISESLVASINDGTDFEPQLKSKGRKKERSRQSTAKSRKFATEKLAHVTPRERAVLKPECLVEHRPGTKIPHVDALSRQVQAVTADGALTKDKVVKEQKADKFCKSLRSGKLNSRSEYFHDADGAIYRRNTGNIS